MDKVRDDCGCGGGGSSKFFIKFQTSIDRML